LSIEESESDELSEELGDGIVDEEDGLDEEDLEEEDLDEDGLLNVAFVLFELSDDSIINCGGFLNSSILYIMNIIYILLILY